MTNNTEDTESTLRLLLGEARDKLVEGKDALDTVAKAAAIGESLDYVLVAIDMRRRELGRAIAYATVGAEADAAMNLPNAAFAEIFERALVAHGYRLIRIDDSAVAS